MSTKYSNPYLGLNNRQYWKTFAKQETDGGAQFSALWEPKFSFDKSSRFVTFGSCFAQHFSVELRKYGFNWYCAEDLPASVEDVFANRHGYRVFSCRTGNIYTTAMLEQWVDWSLGIKACPEEYWAYKSRYFDAFRPVIEDKGFTSLNEASALRLHTLAMFRRCIQDAHVFVFTLGLTEAWVNSDTQVEYPICPLALPSYDGNSTPTFVNHSYDSVKTHLLCAIEKMKSVNPELKILLTVSPVPLIATQQDQHVLVATSQSKAILRAVCADVCLNRDDIDYFPSYEIVTNPFVSECNYLADRRSVKPESIKNVMSHFFSSTVHSIDSSRDLNADSPMTLNEQTSASPDNHCEEELLVAFPTENSRK